MQSNYEKCKTGPHSIGHSIEDLDRLLANTASHQRVGNKVRGYMGSGRWVNNPNLLGIEMWLREVLEAGEAITSDPSTTDNADKSAISLEERNGFERSEDRISINTRTNAFTRNPIVNPSTGEGA